jgi:hypothetical protein
MKRALLVCAALLALPLAGRAAEPNETVIRLTVRPAPAPKPALKYQLLPDLREMNPGNPIQAYSKCFAEQYNLWRNKEEVEKREQWQTMPLHDLPLNEIASRYSRRSPLRYADYAARLDTPDWQLLLQMKSDGPSLLLPDIQGLRELAGALKVRFRAEIAEKRFDDALYTAKTMLALSRHLGEHPTLISELVGTAVANLAIGPLDEMIPQPGSPNLFWALTDLPRPFIDLRKGGQGERVMMLYVFAPINEKATMSDVQVRDAVNRIQQLWKAMNAEKDVAGWLNKLAADEGQVRAARKRLIDLGLAENLVRQFSASQVILLNEKLEFEVRRDEVIKVLGLPYWQAEPVLRAERRPRQGRKDALFAGIGVLGEKMKWAQARLDQRLGLLRCVEALRMYAAEHNGQLPARLEDMHLPLLVDPLTGNPFVYKLDGTTAIVRGTPPPGQENVGLYNVRYEVTIGK